MINVLFFAYEFPPVQTTGSIRPLKFVKYMRDYGFNPIVITTDIESGLRTFGHAKIDESLLEELPNDLTIIRIPTKDFSAVYKNKFKSILHHYFSVHDHIKDNWGNQVHLKIGDIIKENKPQLMYATAPPFGVAPIASKVAKKYKLPLVLDMRDHWSHWGTSSYISKLHFYFTKRAEYKAFKTANKVVSVTEQVINDFKHAHPQLPTNKFEVIPNGFEIDKVNYDSIEINPNQEKQIIGYMGEFYYTPEAHNTIFKKWYQKKLNRIFQYSPRIEDYKYRSPYYFFKALQRLFKMHPELKQKVLFHYIGGDKPWLVDMIDEFQLTDQVILHGRVNYSQSIELAKQFDFCLSTSVKVHGGEDYALASKTFDYVTLNKPILGFVTKGSQRTFLEQSGVSFIFDPDNIEQATQQLFDVLSTKKILNYNKDYLSSFDRKNTAKKLATLFSNINTKQS